METYAATPLAGLEAVVIDTETTGLDSSKARIVQIGAIVTRAGDIAPGQANTFETLVKPDISIPPTSTAIHGISDNDVETAPTFAEVAPNFSSFLAGRLVIGHAIGYDLMILGLEHQRAGIPWQPPPALDIRNLAALGAPELGEHSLDRLCAAFGIEIDGRHTAMGDAIATAAVFAKLIPKLRSKGIRTLGEARAAAQLQDDRDAQAAGHTPTSVAATPLAPPPVLARLDSFPYRHYVRDVMSAPPVFVDPENTLQHVITTLIERKVSSVFLHRSDGTAAIITERDILRALSAASADRDSITAASIAQGPLQTVSQDAFVYRAIGRMDRLSIRHLGVHDQAGSIVGALTTRNLLRHRASTAMMLGDELESATTTAELAAAWAKVPVIANQLIADDVPAVIVAAVISSEIRMVTRRAAAIAQASMRSAGHGEPPCPFAVMVLGSAGRGESLLSPDQDNAIVYQRGEEGGAEDTYFDAMATQMCATLDAVGIPYCKGGVMAQNRAWRMSLTDWRTTIDTWVIRQRPEDLLNVDIFFDGAPVYGNRALADEIWNYAFDKATNAVDFIKLLSESARQKPPAFTLFGNLRKDEAGRLDLKRTGLFPLVTCARALALKHDLRERATPERYLALKAAGIGAASDIDALIDAHATIVGAMLRQQLADIEVGTPPSNRVAVSNLTRAAQRQLNTALTAVDTAIDLVGEGRL